MTPGQRAITIGLCILATVTTRFLPFLVFKGKESPGFVKYLGKALPAAVFGMLVVYSLKDTSVTIRPYGLPEALALGATVGLHLWKRQMLLSIAGGTALYMLLVQGVF